MNVTTGWGWVVRAIVAALVAPLVPGSLFSVAAVLAGNYGMARWYLYFAAVAGYCAIAVVGLPLFLWARKKAWVGILGCTAIGFISGTLLFFGSLLPGAIADPEAARNGILGVLPFLPMSAILGAIAGAAFWVIAQPDGEDTLRR